MEKNFEILNPGVSDAVSILSLDEMDDIVGGATECAKGFIVSNNIMSCKCGFKVDVDITQPPKQNGDLTAPGEKPGNNGQ